MVSKSMSALNNSRPYTIQKCSALPAINNRPFVMTRHASFFQTRFNRSVVSGSSDLVKRTPPSDLNHLKHPRRLRRKEPEDQALGTMRAVKRIEQLGARRTDVVVRGRPSVAPPQVDTLHPVDQSNKTSVGCFFWGGWHLLAQGRCEEVLERVRSHTGQCLYWSG